MKKLWKILTQLLAVAILGFGLWKSYTLYTQNILRREERLHTPLPSLSFTAIVIHTEKAYPVDKSLLSLLEQTHPQLQVFYLYPKERHALEVHAQSLAQCFAKQEKLTCIPIEDTPAKTLYSLVSTLPSQEIVLILHNADFLSHEYVLEKIQTAYRRASTWMTYGSFLCYPSYKALPQGGKPFPKPIVHGNSYRTHEWIPTHPFTCYAGIFQQIPLSCWAADPSLETSWTYLFPLLEMTGPHAQFLPEILCLHQKSTEPSTSVVDALRKHPPQKRLSHFP